MGVGVSAISHTMLPRYTAHPLGVIINPLSPKVPSPQAWAICLSDQFAALQPPGISFVSKNLARVGATASYPIISRSEEI
jgi:hypothetical protein